VSPRMALVSSIMAAWKKLGHPSCAPRACTKHELADRSFGVEIAIRKAGKSRWIAGAERASGKVHGLGDEIHVGVQYSAIL
jgi:hypothetical protein